MKDVLRIFSSWKIFVLFTAGYPILQFTAILLKNDSTVLTAYLLPILPMILVILGLVTWTIAEIIKALKDSEASWHGLFRPYVAFAIFIFELLMILPNKPQI